VLINEIVPTGFTVPRIILEERLIILRIIEDDFEKFFVRRMESMVIPNQYIRIVMADKSVQLVPALAPIIAMDGITLYNSEQVTLANHEKRVEMRCEALAYNNNR
jgi:hypothetical protein